MTENAKPAKLEGEEQEATKEQAEEGDEEEPQVVGVVSVLQEAVEDDKTVREVLTRRDELEAAHQQFGSIGKQPGDLAAEVHHGAHETDHDALSVMESEQGTVDLLRDVLTRRSELEAAHQSFHDRRAAASTSNEATKEGLRNPHGHIAFGISAIEKATTPTEDSTIVSKGERPTTTVHRNRHERIAVGISAIENAPRPRPDSTANQTGRIPIEHPGLHRHARLQPRQNQPGAYIGGPGQGLRRTNTLNYDLIGANIADDQGNIHGTVQAGLLGGDELAQAHEVLDHPSNGTHLIPAARPYDPDVAQKRHEKLQRERQSIIIGLIFVCIAAAMVVGIILAARNKPESGATLERATSIPNVNITNNPSSVASISPTGVLDGLLDSLPEHTIFSINSGSDQPQWKAWNWLSQHQNITYLPEWRKTQLFAMATFFYAFEGENWPWFIKERWMDDSQEECNWFSSAHGYFEASTGEFLQYADYEGLLDPCNGRGEFQTLMLWNLNLHGLTPSIPPEIALLSTLTVLSLTNNDIPGALSSVLPKEIYQLTNLTSLNFFRSEMTGTVPTELGAFTAMTDLDLYGNHLTGQLPTELGLLSAMLYLDLGLNQLTGRLPSELGLLTSMTELTIQGNNLSGPLPSELGTMSDMVNLWFGANQLSGWLPTELGRLSWLEALLLHWNGLFGPIPSEIGMLRALTFLSLGNNLLTSTIPSEVGMMLSLERLFLQENNLTGTLPNELNETVDARLWGNQFWGFVPNHLCLGQSCDCSFNVTLASTCIALIEAPPDWPGRSPPVSTDGHHTTIMLNIHTDQWPEEMEWIWQARQGKDMNTTWHTVIDSGGALAKMDFLYSHALPIEYNATYQLVLSDSYGDGFFHRGWLTLTAANATVLYSSTDTFFASNETLLAAEMDQGAFSQISVALEVSVDGSIQITHHVQ